MKKQHQYSWECANGAVIWINYDPKKVIPESDTRIIDAPPPPPVNTAKLHALSVGGSKWKEQAIKRLNKE